MKTLTEEMDMTVAVQGLVNLFLNMDRKSREMFTKLLVAKMEEEELDLLLQVIDTRHNPDSTIKEDFKHLDLKEDDVKKEPGLCELRQNSDQNIEDENNFMYEVSTKVQMLNDEKPPFNEFQCDQCPFVSDQLANLKRHFTLTHAGKEKKNCSYCDKTFVNKKELKEHIATHPEYKDEKPFMCDICPKSFRVSDSLKRHKDMHNGIKPENKFMCDLCPKSFYVSNDLKRHKYMHDGNKPWICDQCPYTSSRKDHLEDHKERYHSDKEFKPDDITEPLVCDFCSKTFTSSRTFKIHIREHKRIREKKFTCDQCNFKSANVSILNYHKMTHTGERPFPCNICSKTFRSQGHLNRHIKGVHMGEKTHFCDLCPKAFFYPNGLEMHKTVHTGERKFMCDLCSMTFTTPQSLTIHKESIHEGIRYDCEQCDYTATNKGTLWKHVAAVHEGIKYDCQECDYKATTKQSLNNHVESIHLGIRHECSQCDHKATTKSNLLQHVAYVHESIQHDCKECDYTTYKKRSFLKHMTGHRKAQEVQNQTDYSTISPLGMSVN